MTESERAQVVAALELAQQWLGEQESEVLTIDEALRILRRKRAPSQEMFQLRADCAADTLEKPRG